MISLSPEVLAEIEGRWHKALSFYKKRSPVVFASYCRFWEAHGFVQQSLARVLTAHGIRVVWLDGAGWRPYSPVVPPGARRLRVRQLPSLPCRRLGAVDRATAVMQAAVIRRELTRGGKSPLFWVQAGIDERVAAKLPYVDVFSVFDDPYRHAPDGPLCAKARLVVCQSSHATRLLAAAGEKVKRLLPPVDLSPENFKGGAVVTLPPGFPSHVMGYLGSFFPDSFDFALLEALVKRLPDRGFLLMGRTDAAGQAEIARLKAHKNFCHLPWIPRAGVASAWKLLDVTLLLYKPFREQDGAFATKALESIHFGVPLVGTELPKTEDLAPWFPRATTAERLAELALSTSEMPQAKREEAYRHFAYEMHPKLHLARVAEWLT